MIYHSLNVEKKNTVIIFEKYLYYNKPHLKAYLTCLLKLRAHYCFVIVYFQKLIQSGYNTLHSHSGSEDCSLTS